REGRKSRKELARVSNRDKVAHKVTRHRYRLAEYFCALIAHIDIHMHKFGMSSEPVVQIRSLAQFLCVGSGSVSVSGRVADAPSCPRKGFRSFGHVIYSWVSILGR